MRSLQETCKDEVTLHFVLLLVSIDLPPRLAEENHSQDESEADNISHGPVVLDEARQQLEIHFQKEEGTTPSQVDDDGGPSPSSFYSFEMPSQASSSSGKTYNVSSFRVS